MTRRQAREYILQTLFAYDFTGKILVEKDIKEEIKEKGAGGDVTAFILDVLNGTIRNIEEIDETIVTISRNWRLERLAAVDRNILRFAAYELMFRNDIPAPVTINEAVEIAKKYSTAESFSLINGILDKISGRKN